MHVSMPKDVRSYHAGLDVGGGGGGCEGVGMTAAALRFCVASSAARPALPSNTNGPISFLGVIGPSTPAGDVPRPLGLGVRVECLSEWEVGSSRCDPPLPTAFRTILTGAEVAFEIG